MIETHLMAWVSMLTELLGGLAVLAGACVALASVPMTILLTRQSRSGLPQPQIIYLREARTIFCNVLTLHVLT